MGTIVSLWLSYITIVAYNILDILHSKFAFDLGIGEANPVVDLMINASNSWFGMVYIKAFFILIFGVFLVFQTRVLRIKLCERRQ